MLHSELLSHAIALVLAAFLLHPIAFFVKEAAAIHYCRDPRQHSPETYSVLSQYSVPGDLMTASPRTNRKSNPVGSMLSAASSNVSANTCQYRFGSHLKASTGVRNSTAPRVPWVVYLVVAFWGERGGGGGI